MLIIIPSKWTLIYNFHSCSCFTNQYSLMFYYFYNSLFRMLHPCVCVNQRITWGFWVNLWWWERTMIFIILSSSMTDWCVLTKLKYLYMIANIDKWTLTTLRYIWNFINSTFQNIYVYFQGLGFTSTMTLPVFNTSISSVSNSCFVTRI